MTTAPSRRRPWVARALMLLGGLASGLLLAEGLARVIAPPGAADILFNAPGNAPDGLYVTDRELLHRPHPGFEGTIRSLGYAVPLRVNSSGLRGPEVGEHVRARWLAIGDSFTFAAQVPEEDTFELRLSAAAQLEVLNGGADAWSTWQAAILYKRLDPTLQLDGAILMLFLGNDLHDNERFGMEQQRLASRPEGNPLVAGFTPAWQRFFNRNSYLLGQWRMRQRLASYADPKDPERNRWRGEISLFSQDGAPELAGKLGATERALREAQLALRSAGDPLMVAVAPPAFAVDEARLKSTFELVGLDPAKADPQAPTRAVMGLLKGLGIPACDLSPALQASVLAGNEPYFLYDGHWTAAGHDVVASQLQECLAKMPSGPPPQPPAEAIAPSPAPGAPPSPTPGGGPPVPMQPGPPNPPGPPGPPR